MTALGTTVMPCKFSAGEMRALLAGLFRVSLPAVGLADTFMDDYAAVRDISSYEELKAYIVQLDSVDDSNVYRERKQTISAMLLVRLSRAQPTGFPQTMQRDPSYASMSHSDIRSRAESVLLTCALWSAFVEDDSSPESVITLPRRDVSTRRAPRGHSH